MRKSASEIIDELPTINDAGLFVNAETYAHVKGISPATARRLAKSGTVKAVKVGKQWRFPVSALYEGLEVE